MDIDDDDMIVVVVDDSGNISEHKPLLDREIKQEPGNDSASEYPNAITIDELLDTVVKHGEALDVSSVIKKEASDDYEYEYLEGDEEEEEYRTDSQHQFVLPDCTIPSDEDNNYGPEEQNDSDDDQEYVEWHNMKIRKKITRHRQPQRKPWQVESFVDSLRNENPQYLEDEESLVAAVADIMRSTKPPPPPPDFYRIHFEDDLFECIFCNRTTDSLNAAQRHFQDLHGTKYLVCLACGLTFRSLPNLYKHERRCLAEDAVIVLKARASAVGRKGRHRPFMQPKLPKVCNKNSSERKSFNCTICSSVFVTKTGLTAHMFLHEGRRPFRCAECPASYTSKSALGRHMYVKHDDRHYECDHCGATFKIKSAIASHMDTHLPERRFPCLWEGCGRRFAQKHALRMHEDGFHRRLPHPCACKVCPKRFPRNSLLKVHMKKAHGLELITRKMFFKKLPMLTDTQVQQAAAFFKGEIKQDINELDTTALLSNSFDDKPLKKDIKINNMPKPKVVKTEPIEGNEDEAEETYKVEIVPRPVTQPISVRDIINSAKGYKVMVVEQGRHTKTVKLADLRRKFLENIDKDQLEESVEGEVEDSISMPDIAGI